MVFKIHVKHTSVYFHLLYIPENTTCGLGSITRFWLEKIVLLRNWNDLGSWSLGTKVVQLQDLLLRGQENPLRHNSEWSAVGVPPGKTQSGTFPITNFFLLSNIPYIWVLLCLSYFSHDWLVGWFLCIYVCWGLECTVLKTIHSLEAVKSCSSRIINSQFHILLALP